ncbi:MAG: hypothetical protein K2J76_03065 [Oscillospiraceae bacterium]|nr:hypothetical protein [Oscillospiraceae bacterium]
MTVKELCEKYPISQQAVYAKIKRKSAQLDGHITKSGGLLVIDKYAEECLKPKCADFTLVRKIQNLQNQFDNKNTECENLKKSLSDEIAKNEKLQNCLDSKNLEIEKLQSQLAKRDLKKSDFDNLADMLKSEILKISDKIDDVQNSISEITTKNSNGIIRLLKK